MKTICSECKGENIHQQATIMLPINDPENEYGDLLADMEWEDYYWCKDCWMECIIEEVEEK